MNSAYVAGIMDGEGSIGFSQSRKGAWFPRIHITNTHRGLIEEIKRSYGGQIQSAQHEAHWKRAYVWRLCYSSCVDFLDDLFPYLIIKRPQAKCILLWDAVRPGSHGRWDPECLRLLRDQMTWLNGRGSEARTIPEPMLLALGNN